MTERDKTMAAVPRYPGKPSRGKPDSLIGLIAASAAVVAIGCATAEKETGCSNAACYGQCLSNAWSDLTESYWVFEAYCVNADTCKCMSHCDDAKCDDYCVSEKSASSGSCDIFNCACFGNEVDAGADAGPDAAAN